VQRHRKKRKPKLSYSKKRGLGYHVSYRDPITNVPKKKRFGMIPEAEAEIAYHEWLARHLKEDEPTPIEKGRKPKSKRATSPAASEAATKAKVVPGSLLEVAGGLISYWQSIARKPGKSGSKGTIAAKTCGDRKKHILDFLKHLNSNHGRGAVGKIKLQKLEMVDVENYNRSLVLAGYSESQVSKRLWAIKKLIDRSGRLEYGYQQLHWNWSSMDRLHGESTEPRRFPSLAQLKKLISACDVRGKARSEERRVGKECRSRWSPYH